MWARDLNVSTPESPYLAFIVGLHVATALALLVFFWRDWVRIVRGFGTSLRYRRMTPPDERLAWMIILGHHPGRHNRAVTGAHLPHGARPADPGRHLPHHQRRILYGAESRAAARPWHRNGRGDPRVAYRSAFAAATGTPGTAAAIDLNARPQARYRRTLPPTGGSPSAASSRQR